MSCRPANLVELHLFHVLQGDAGTQGHRETVAGAGSGVRRDGVELAGTAGAKDNGLGLESQQLSRLQVDGRDAGGCPVLHDEVDG
ncbi:MAG: hypothetical protein MAG451_01392 [Anaerolineales bacterium]|nr:hypothetical protein [Anaerolineales bacterium]